MAPSLNSCCREPVTTHRVATVSPSATVPLAAVFVPYVIGLAA